MLRHSVVIITLLAAVSSLAAGCGFRSSTPPPADGPNWQHVMMSEVNEWRRANGLAPLAWCGTLSHGAQGHSYFQAATNQMVHSNVGALASAYGYTPWSALAENVAYGYSGARDVVHAWLNSPGHRH